MPEPFKNNINEGLIREMARAFERNYEAFDSEGFIKDSLQGLENLELKERADQIAKRCVAYLPKDFHRAAEVIEKSLHPESAEEGSFLRESTEEGIRGWAIVSLQEYVAEVGIDQPEIALPLLKEMTKRLSSEFGIRYFLIEHPLMTLKTMQVWVKDPSEHVRRLVSEGTRTRLPWGIRLNQFIADPSPVIPFLESLKDDPSEYVRRSVANNLNDLSKDHPDLVCRIAEQWMVGASRDRVRLVKHALRTLVKAGNPRALEILGFGSVKVKIENVSISPSTVSLGEPVEILFLMKSTATAAQQIIIDLQLQLKKANGTLAPKVFKWKSFELKGKAELVCEKKLLLKPVTTRKYYTGTQKIELLLNGKVHPLGEFELIVP